MALAKTTLTTNFFKTTMSHPGPLSNCVLVCCAVLAILVAAPGCSLNKLVLRKAAGALTGGGGTVFAGDNDPELIEDALPFVLKTYESLLAGLPDDEKLLLATGSAFCSYSYAFIYVPADTMSDIHIDAKNSQLQRAKKMYLRARGYLLHALDVRHPGFERLALAGKVDSSLALVDLSDTTYLYWVANSWMGAFAADKFDIGLSVSTVVPVAFMRWILDHNETFGNGSVHDFFVSYLGALPASMGGDKAEAREHFKRSLELSGGRASTYVALATAVCVPEQNAVEFKQLLEQALAIPTDRPTADRLATIVTQRKAQWLLDNIDSFILSETKPEDLEP